MDIFNEFLDSFFFPVIDSRMIYPVLICFILITLVLFYLSKMDITYREIPSIWIPIVLWIPGLFCAYQIYGMSFDFFVGFFFLMIFFWVIQFLCDLIINKDKPDDQCQIFVGGADILCAPLYTLWFGAGIIVFLGIFLLVLIILNRAPFIKKKLDDLCIRKEMVKYDYIPLLACLQVTYCIALLLYLL